MDQAQQRSVRLSPVQLLMLALRVTMEVGIVGAFAYWGVHVASSTVLRVLYGIGAPAVAFGVWGAVDFRRAGRRAEALRLTEEMLISLLAALALYSAGRPVAGGGLALLSIGYHALVYATGSSLLEPRHPTEPPPEDIPRNP